MCLDWVGVERVDISASGDSDVVSSASGFWVGFPAPVSVGLVPSPVSDLLGVFVVIPLGLLTNSAAWDGGKSNVFSELRSSLFGDAVVLEEVKWSNSSIGSWSSDSLGNWDSLTLDGLCVTVGVTSEKTLVFLGAGDVWKRHQHT